MKKSFKRKLLLLICFLYMTTNFGNVSFIVNAESKKETFVAPINGIVITGVEDVEIEKDSTFDYLSGIEAVDRNGLSISNSLEVLGDVDVNTIGDYQLVYTAKDETGESKSITRNIKVIDKKEMIIDSVDGTKKDEENSIKVNEAIPEKKGMIIGAKNLTVKLGKTINLMDGMEAFDENGDNITALIKVEGSVDFNKEGDYKVKYSINKEGMLICEVERNITVVDSENIINIYTEEEKVEDNKLAFSIIFSKKEKRFLVVNKCSDELLRADIKKDILKLNILDKYNKQKLTLDLLGKDRTLVNEEGINKEFEKIEKLSYEDGDFIEIEVSDPKYGIDIQGNVLGDVTIDKEDYSDGIDDIDYIKNVRFRINKNTLETVYNRPPVIKGVENAEVGNINSFDLLSGVTVEDDHDGIIDIENMKVIESIIKEDEIKKVTYEVRDSWGRSTAIERLISKVIPVSLADNIIVVKGINFAGSDSDIRFKIAFDTTNKRITIPFFDRKILSNKQDKYFEFILYDKDGKVKTSVELIGKDRSDSEKLNAIKDYNYESGDYISLWHYEAPSKIHIEGGVLDSGDKDFSLGIDPDILEAARFKVTDGGLQYVENGRPTINIVGDNPLTIKRGERPDLLSDIEILDDLEAIDKSNVKIDGFNPMIEGKQIITYTVSDSWGLEAIATREVIVNPKSDLDGINIDFMTEDGLNRVFTLNFDDINKRFVVKNQTNNTVNSSSRREAIIIKVFNKYNKSRKTFRIYGDSTGNSKEVNNLNRFVYSDEEYIEIWMKDTVRGIRLNGNITDQREDYTDGVQDSGNLYNVRFKMENGSFISVYNDAPVIVGPRDTSILRGEKFNPLSQLASVTDDHDKTIDNSLVEVEFNSDSINNIGVYDVVYKVKDSWGREGKLVTKLTVKPAKGIEANSIKLFADAEEMINIGFDSFTKKLKVLSYNDKAYVDGNNSDNAFEVIIYESDGLTEKKNISFKFEDTVNADKIAEINNIDFSYNDKIIVKAYKKDKVSFAGTIINISPGERYENGFSSDDSMFNTRFIITESGLDDNYNNSPQIIGVLPTRVILNSNFDNMAGITANDDEDGDLTSRIIVSGTIDTSMIGVQKISYTVTDNLGRSATTEREVKVVNTYTSNRIEFLNEANTSAIAFRINDLGTRFEFIDRPSVQFDSDNLDEVAYRINVFNKNGEVINNIELLGKDTASSTKLDILEDISILDGYTFSVWARTPKRIKISGDIEKDISITEDYTDGIDNVDFMENVRFRLNDDKIKAIYNEAPELNIPTEVFEMYLGETVDLSAGVTITDDHDKLGKESIEVVGDLTEVGLKGVILIVTDSWGRKSREYTRYVNIKKGLERHEIIFSRVINKAGKPENDVNNYDNIPGVKIRFDESNKKVVAEKLSDGNFYNSDEKLIHYIGIYDKNGISKLEKKINGASTNTVVSWFDNINFEYGDYMRFTFTHDDTLTIKGEVIDGQQEYDPYVNIGYDLENTKFVFTKEGLKAEYEDPYKDALNHNTITFYEAFAGNMGMRFKIDSATKNITTEYNKENYYFDNNNFDNNTVFRIHLYGSDGIQKKVTSVRGRQRVKGTAEAWNNTAFEYGDYLHFSQLNRRAKNLRITGDIGTRVDQVLESFVDGVDNTEGFLNTRFYLTTDGIVAFRNDGVTFTGAEETNITVGTLFNPMDGVLAESKIDGDVTSSIDISGSVKTDTVGEYTITYSVRDSWGRTTTKERVINVRPKLYNNVVEVYKQNDLTNPAITIRADNKTGKYVVNSNGNELLDPLLGRESAFKMWVVDSNGNTKVNINLLGIDSINSSKLNLINETSYSEGDFIKVWRNPESTSNPSVIETLKIKGEIDNAPEDYSDGINDMDYMNNVIFKVRSEGLEAEYNAPAVFTGVKDKVILKGERFEPLDGVSATDDKGISGDIKVLSDVNTNRIGTYSVTYTVEDNWGRITSKTISIKVDSKLLANNVQVYGKNASGASELKFTLGFNTTTRKFTVDINSDTDLDMLNGTEETIISVYDRYGEILETVTLSGTDKPSSSKLDSLESITYANNMFIAFRHSDYNKIKINGDIVNNSEDYSNGFDSNESMVKTRFRLTDDGLREARQSLGSFSGLTHLKVKRGEKVDLLDGVTINNSSDEIDYSKIEITNFDIEKAGVQEVTYSYTDSWGTVITGLRRITVEYRNDLEKMEINVLDNRNSTALTLRFDELHNNFNIEIYENSIGNLPEDTNLIEIETFDRNGSSLGQASVNSNNLQTADLRSKVIEAVRGVSFEYGGSVYISTYDSENKFNIKGTVTGDSVSAGEDYLDGVQDKEYIEHVRFTITEDSLDSVHNMPPVISGLTESEVRRGNDFDHFWGVTVTDDKDNGIGNDSIIIDELLDIDSIGKHTLIYRVVDSWGRETVEERIVYVTAALEENTFEFYSDINKEKIFTLNFNSKNKTFKIIKGSSTDNIDTSAGVDKAIEIVKYNKSGEKIESYSLTGDENKDSSVLDSINETHYNYGEYISIYVSKPKTGVKIQGTMLKDNTTLPEDYGDGIDDSEYMDNVRFRLTELGLEAIYNRAPELNVPLDNLVRYKQLDINDYNLLEGITFTDDHTAFTESDIKVIHNDISTLGTHEISYELIDAWGRSSGVKKRNLEIKNALERNYIEFERMTSRSHEWYERDIAFRLRFDIEEGTDGGMLRVTDASSNPFSYHTGGGIVHYKVKIEGRNGVVKYNEDFIALDKGIDEKISKLNTLRFVYGDKITIYQSMHKGFKIMGPVPNGIEDYSNGADLGQELQDTVFTILEEGIVANYTPSYSDSGNITNSIQWNLGINGNFGFRLNFDMKNKKIIGIDRDPLNEFVDTLGTGNNLVFRIEHRKRSGELISGFNVRQRQRPHFVLQAFNDTVIEYGEYIQVISYIKPKNLRVTGKLITNGIQQFENYEDGVDDKDRTKHIRFYFTPDGLYAYENEPPKILGATDLNIIKGEQFNVRDGVEVVDDLDRPEDVNLVIDDRTFDSSMIGAHQVTYVATDTAGRSSTYDRFLFITARPIITLKNQNDIYVEKGSLTSGKVVDYLKNIVSITDEEDDDAKVAESLKITGTFNPDNEGIYPIKYWAIDSDSYEAELDINIHVVKTINVSAPISVPFQVVTNLKTPEPLKEEGYQQHVITNQKNPNHSASEFVSAQLKLLNNHTSEVKVSIKEFNRTEGSLEVVSPDSVKDWNNLSAEESMSKMALGIYNSKGLIGAPSSIDNPVWLNTNIAKTNIGILPRRSTTSSDPSEARLSLVSKHGSRFKGGKTKGKFNIIFEFE